jgi:hypothetical protein
MAIAMVGHVPDERPTEYTRFVQAVLAFAVDPGPANVERYLAASQRAIICLRRHGRKKTSHARVSY